MRGRYALCLSALEHLHVSEGGASKVVRLSVPTPHDFIAASPFTLNTTLNENDQKPMVKCKDHPVISIAPDLYDGN